MFARMISAQAGAEGFDGTIRLFEQQLPGARQLPGFKGYYLLTDAETGKVVVISLWETREQMDAVTAGAGPSGIRDQHNPATGLTDMHLETYNLHDRLSQQAFDITPASKRFPDSLWSAAAGAARIA